jgi:hypothetical protein
MCVFFKEQLTKPATEGYQQQCLHAWYLLCPVGVGAAADAIGWMCLLAAVLSARLGLGKGGLSWGSPELLAESLQVSNSIHQVSLDF